MIEIKYNQVLVELIRTEHDKDSIIFNYRNKKDKILHIILNLYFLLNH